MASENRIRDDHTATKRHEAVAFFLLAVVLFPLLSIILVGGFGFIIWMQHLFFTPTGM